MKIINCEKKEMIPLTEEENKVFALIKMMKIIKIKEKLQITVITQENLVELPIVNAT